jgi:hypothetical protein
LFRVTEDGGVPVPVTNAVGPRQTHRFPAFIDGGTRFLFVNQTRQEDSGVYVGSLDGTAPTRLVPDLSQAQYVPNGPAAGTGAVLFRRDTTLVALPFDAITLRATGGAVPVAPNLTQGAFSPAAAFAASDTGVLVYRPTNALQSQTLTWIDRATGKPTPTKIDSQAIESLALSRTDESQLAVTVRATQSSSDLWLDDLRRDVATRFTFGPGRRRWPVWSPDQRLLVFAAVGGPAGDDIFRKPTTGGSAEERMPASGINATPLDISPDGSLLL